MDLCWRWPPIIVLVAVLGHATSWFGAVTPDAAGHADPAARLGGLLSGADSLVSQIFAWLFLLLAFEVLCCLATYLIGEYKLRRLYDRPPRRWARAVPPPALTSPAAAPRPAVRGPVTERADAMPPGVMPSGNPRWRPSHRSASPAPHKLPRATYYPPI